MAVLNPTQWYQGYTVVVGNETLATNSSFTIIDNLGNFIVTTPTYQEPKFPTTWTKSGA